MSHNYFLQMPDYLHNELVKVTIILVYMLEFRLHGLHWTVRNGIERKIQNENIYGSVGDWMSDPSFSNRVASNRRQWTKKLTSEKKEEIWHIPMTKAPTPTEKSKKQRDNTKPPPKASITQRLRTYLERSVWVTTATRLVW